MIASSANARVDEFYEGCGFSKCCCVPGGQPDPSQLMHALCGAAPSF